MRDLLRGFWKLTWVETKVFAREPMGFVGSIIMPAIVFVLLGRAIGVSRPPSAAAMIMPEVVPSVNVAILAEVVMAIG